METHMDTLPVLEVGCEGSMVLLLWVTTVMCCSRHTAVTNVGAFDMKEKTGARPVRRHTMPS